MKELGRWFGGAIFALLAILGLAMAANARDSGIQVFGFVMLIFGILMLFRFVAFVTGNDKEQA